MASVMFLSLFITVLKLECSLGGWLQFTACFPVCQIDDISSIFLTLETKKSQRPKSNESRAVVGNLFQVWVETKLSEVRRGGVNLV